MSSKIPEDLIVKISSVNRKTCQGVIKGRLAKKQFERIKYKGINVANVPAKQPTL